MSSCMHIQYILFFCVVFVFSCCIELGGNFSLWQCSIYLFSFFCYCGCTRHDVIVNLYSRASKQAPKIPSLMIKISFIFALFLIHKKNSIFKWNCWQNFSTTVAKSNSIITNAKATNNNFITIL